MSISGKPTAHAGFMLAVLRIAENAGIDTRPILRANGLAPDIDRNADISVPVRTIRNLYRDIAAASGDPWFFWNHVQEVPLDRFGYYGHLAATAETVGDAFASLSRNIGKLVSRSVVAIEDAGPDITISYDVMDEGTAVSREISEAVVAFALLIVRTALGKDWCPKSIRFEHERPASLAPYRAVCAVKYEFGAPATALTFERSALAAAMPGANLYLQKAVESYVTDVIARRAGSSKIALDVRTEIAARIRQGAPTLQDTAISLGMSARTLQRRLRDADTTYSDVLEDLRRELADRMLDDGDMTISEIGYTLGYADISSFDRAYRNWTGRTPADIRRNS